MLTLTTGSLLDFWYLEKPQRHIFKVWVVYEVLYTVRARMRHVYNDRG